MHFLREPCFSFRPPDKGRRECRALDAPAASRTIKNKVHEHSHHRFSRNHPTFPTRWLNGCFVLSSVRRAFWPPSPVRSFLLADLTPASGCQNHTTSPSASGALVRSTVCVHRIPPRVDDVAQRPFGGTGWPRI